MANRKGDNYRIGMLGEDVAAKYIVKKGFKIVVRNYRKSWGELDIVAIKDDILHFFEVKSVIYTRQAAPSTYRPEENVHSFKVRQIRRMVKTYMFEHRYSPEQHFGFHVLSVYLDMKRRYAKVIWLKDVIL